MFEEREGASELSASRLIERRLGDRKTVYLAEGHRVESTRPSKRNRRAVLGRENPGDSPPGGLTGAVVRGVRKSRKPPVTPGPSRRTDDVGAPGRV